MPVMDDIEQLKNELETCRIHKQQYQEQMDRIYYRILTIQSLFSDIAPDEDSKILSRSEAQGVCYCLDDVMNDCKF